jgi:hypothetical protein
MQLSKQLNWAGAGYRTLGLCLDVIMEIVFDTYLPKWNYTAKPQTA